MRTPVRLALALAASAALAAPPTGLDPQALVDVALARSKAYDKLTWLCDRIGNRLSGSRSLERAVAWATAEMKRDGLDKVWTEPVKVPRWQRGVETGRITAPVDRPLVMLALGGSDPTPAGGVAGEVVEVASFDELKALGEKVKGRIVLYNRAIEASFGDERGYGSAANLRHRGAVEAARLGAAGTLIRSLGTADFRLPHTGSMEYEPGVRHIPSAAIPAEDAELIHRLLASGETVKVSFTLGCRNAGEADSANVIGEIRGREKPDEIVVIGGHLDSWDVGQGAHDDGAGVAVVMETMRLLKELGTPPRRTIRAVLFTNEENGLRGGKGYLEAHKGEMDRHVAAIEADSGGFRPMSFGVEAGDGGVAMAKALVTALAGIAADNVTAGGGGADIGPMADHGVPQIGLRVEAKRYFDYHHTPADTLDKVDPHDLAMDVAAVAVLAYGLADMEGTLPRLPVKAKPGAAK